MPVDRPLRSYCVTDARRSGNGSIKVTLKKHSVHSNGPYFDDWLANERAKCAEDGLNDSDLVISLLMDEKDIQPNPSASHYSVSWKQRVSY